MENVIRRDSKNHDLVVESPNGQQGPRPTEIRHIFFVSLLLSKIFSLYLRKQYFEMTHLYTFKKIRRDNPLMQMTKIYPQSTHLCSFS